MVEHRDAIRIFLLEDHDVIRRCSAFALEREPDLEVVATAGSLEEARNSASKRWPEVDIAIIGLLLPDGNGTDLIADLREAKPGLPVIVHTVLTQHEAHSWALKMGANEVISKQSPLEELVAAIKRLGRGKQGGAEPARQEEEEEEIGMRVLAACEPRYYREVIGETIRGLRPAVEVVIVDPDELADEVSHLDPDLVISVRPASLDPGGRSAWVEFVPYEKPAATVSIGGRREELDEMTLEDLLWVVDQADELSRMRKDLRNH